MKAKKSNKAFGKMPVFISVLLHAMLLVVLVWGADFTFSPPTPQASGAVMQAVVIDPNVVKQQAQQIRNQREAAAKKEQERLDKLRRESEQLERNRKAEEERIRDLKEQQVREAKAAREAEKAAAEKLRQEQARAAKAAAERKVQEEAAKKAEAERIAKEAAAVKAEQERVAREKAAQEAKERARREQEAAERAEQERIAKEKAAKEAAEKARREQQRLEQERKEKEAALNSIFSGLESESQTISAARSQYVANEAQRWGAIYTQLIQQNLLLEDSFRGRQCKVNLRLIPTGTDAIVGELKIVEGDSKLCAATRRAVAQVGNFPLPKADESDVIEKLKNINLTVVPD